ncbi:leucine-rich repeats and immunoglobulin-like domains protein sma-10 [Amphiura filiformis]|uniref:leucine-rich repeats and immunoglobulin-like domains protein sma-10 n=1 Tax=Amphiura filiformis TaxID=82378 RepID=UPI003B210145
MSPTPGIPICLILLICYQAVALHKTICDDMCHCHDNEVDCSAQLGDLHDLHELTANIPNDTDTLDVAWNQIEFIGDALYHLPVLLKLNVANNKIAKQYRLPSSLIRLYSNNNTLTDISDMFNNTINIEIMYLHRVQLESLHTGSLKGLPTTLTHV